MSDEKRDISDVAATGRPWRLVTEPMHVAERNAKPENEIRPSSPSEQRMFDPSSRRIARLPDQVRTDAATSRPFRVSFLDDIATGLLDTDLVVIGAQTGAGKTTLASILAQTAAAAGARVHYLALEAHEGEIEMRMLFRIMARMAWERRIAAPEELVRFTYGRWRHGRCEEVVSRVERDAMQELTQATSTMSTLYRTGRFRTADLVGRILGVSGQSDLIVLDHLHFLDDGDEDEIRAMRRTVKAISDAIQDARTPVVAIAHLRKMDTRIKRVVPHISEFHGSSDITKVATKVITLAPVERPRAAHYIADTFLHVSKDRLEGEQNYTAIVGFDLRSYSYLPRYELGRLVKGGSEWQELPIAEVPWWAVHERRRS